MDPHKLAITLAIAAGWLSFNCLIIAMYYMLSGRGVLESGMWRGGEWLRSGQKLAPSAKPDVPSPLGGEVAIDQAAINSAALQLNSASTLPEDDSVEEVVPESDDNNANHVLFVMFNQPDLALNKKLHTTLQNWDAHYDAAMQVYSVPGVTPQNPVLVTNAYPPGVMPSADSFQQEEHLISGVSVILKKPKRKRGFDKVQLEKFVAFTQELAALGGDILDAQRQAATASTFYAIQHK